MMTKNIQLILTIVIMTVISGCCSLPINQNKYTSVAHTINVNSYLAQHVLPDNLHNKGKTGALMLYDGLEAFIARLSLIERAENSIDAQYYLWHDDISGRLLYKKIYEAADRGVKVRLLLDDNGTVGMDSLLSKLNAHKNIQVRLFNPYIQRKLRSIAYITEPIRINRRMHNKSLTVDHLVSIVGGRNIGDEYFEATNDLMFADLDVSIVGDVVPKIQSDFDRYWQSKFSYPLEQIVTINNQQSFQLVDKHLTKEYLLTLFSAKHPYYLNLTPTDSKKYLTKSENTLIWADAHYMSDAPNKIENSKKSNFNDSVIAKLHPFVASTKEQLILVSPYFVPTPRGVKYLVDLVQQGKQVIIVTNSLAATDVIIAHAGYKKYRKELLKKGVQIYEFKPEPKNDEYGSKEYLTKYKDDYDVNGILPNSDASLHAKFATVDDKYFFIGSSNIDPRSAILNTELGIVFESERLTKAVNKAFHQNKNIINYHLKLINGKIEWHTLENGERILYYHEPKSTLKDQALTNILSMLPIDGWL